MRWVLMLFVILAAVMGGEARAVVVMGRVVMSERVGKEEEKASEALRVESERAFLGAGEAVGVVDGGPLVLWFQGGVAVARSDGLSGTGTTGCRRVSSTSWRYDLADNRVARTETEERRAANSTSWVRTAVADQRCLYRNAAGTGPNGRNQLSQSWETRTRWEAESGAPLELSEQTVSYRYDPRGNRTRRTTRLWKQARTTGSAAWPVPTVTDTDEALEWDGENRLTGMWRGRWKEELAQVPFASLVGQAVEGSTVWRWGYDHRSRRVQRDEPGSGGERLRTVTVFSGGTSAAEYTETAAAGSAWTVPPAATVQHVRGPDLGGGTKGLLYSLRRSLQPNEQSTWLPTFNRYNGRGDVVAQSDIDGTTTWAASYQADGRRTAEAGTNIERHRACTKEEDPTGLLNEGFRYRDMETGTFISRDPLGLVDGPNVYCYVRQNPWTMWDPEGLTGWALPPQYAESAEYREGFHKGMALGAKFGLVIGVGVGVTVATGGLATAASATVFGSGTVATSLSAAAISGAAGSIAANSTGNVLDGKPVEEGIVKAGTTGALFGAAGQVVGNSALAFKQGVAEASGLAASAKATADAANAMAQAIKARGGAAGGLVTAEGGVPGLSFKAARGVTTAHNPRVQAALDSIPKGMRSSFHCGCAEPQMASKLLNAGGRTEGAVSYVGAVRAPGNPANGRPMAPCSSCNEMNGRLGIIDMNATHAYSGSGQAGGAAGAATTAAERERRKD
jgi:RHS repeat-associated protein